MAVEVGGIYFSAELDDANLKKSIKDIESNIRLMSGSVSANVNKSTESFKTLTKTITYSQDSIAGLTNRVDKLQNALNKSKIGSEGFDKLNQALDETKAKLSESGKKSWAEGKRTVHPNTIAACKANCDKQRGVPLTDEHRANVGKASKRAIRTPEWKAAISNGIKLHWEKRKASSSV